MTIELNKNELINYIMRHRAGMTVEKLKSRDITQLVMIKTKIEVEQYKRVK